jgi:hypothetical protein
MSDQPEKGLSYVDQIKEAYDALMGSHQTSLMHALILGDLLNQAKDAVGHGNWANWLKKHCSQISQRTANVYMKLAVNKEKFEDPTNSQRAANFAAKDDLSIRAAIEAVNEADGGGLKPEKPQKPPRAPRAQTGSTATAQQPTSTDKGGLEGELKNADADEIIRGLGHDADKLTDLAERSIATLSPEKVCDALRKAWTKDQFEDLIKRLNSYLSTLRTTPPPNELGAGVARRM